MWNFIKPDQPIVLVNLRVQAKVQSGWRGIVRQSEVVSKAAETNATTQSTRTRQVYIDGRMHALPTYQRTQLVADSVVVGPAIIEEQSSCLIFKAGQTARIDAVGNLRISL
jgi:N-methylhydantoinase A